MTDVRKGAGTDSGKSGPRHPEAKSVRSRVESTGWWVSVLQWKMCSLPLMLQCSWKRWMRRSQLLPAPSVWPPPQAHAASMLSVGQNIHHLLLCYEVMYASWFCLHFHSICFAPSTHPHTQVSTTHTHTHTVRLTHTPTHTHTHTHMQVPTFKKNSVTINPSKTENRSKNSHYHNDEECKHF